MSDYPCFHITLRACDICSLRSHSIKWYSYYNNRKKEAMREAIRIYLKKRTNWQ
jgi:hypothetical protein